MLNENFENNFPCPYIITISKLFFLFEGLQVGSSSPITNPKYFFLLSIMILDCVANHKFVAFIFKILVLQLNFYFSI